MNKTMNNAMDTATNTATNNATKNFHIKKVAVLGAGVMGAQIAAHLTNAGVKAILFDLPAKEGPKNGIVLKALDGLTKLTPDPLSSKARQ